MQFLSVRSRALAKGLFVSGLLLTSLAAFAQGTKPTTITIDSKAPVVQPVTNNMGAVFPAVATAINQRGVRPENPKNPAALPVGPANSLSTGGTTLGRNILPGTQFPGIGFTGSVPPDPHIAVGQDYVVQVVNTNIAIFNKWSGKKLLEQPLTREGFYTTLRIGDFTFDPKVVYDPRTDRFFVVCLDVDFNGGQSRMIVSVSQSGNPLGFWNHFIIENGNLINSVPTWLDYPSITVNHDTVAVTGNLFPFGNSPIPIVGQVLLMSKAEMMNGQPIRAVKYVPAADPNIGLAAFTLQLARPNDLTGTAPVFGIARRSTTTMSAFAFTRQGPATWQARAATVAVPAFSPAGVLAPANGNVQADTIGDRMMDAAARGNRVYAAHTTQITTPSTRTTVDWYEFNMGTWPTSGAPSLAQSGKITAPGSDFTFMPSINVNRIGDIAVAYSLGGQGRNLDFAVSGRRSTDPPGAMSAPTVVGQSGTVRFGGQTRWGDYSAVVVDPTDGVSFWVTGELTSTNLNFWRTEIARFNVTATQTASGAPTGVTPVLGTFISGGVPSFTTVDTNRYIMDSVGVANRGQFATYDLSFTGLLPLASAFRMTLTLNADITAGAANGTILFWNIRTQTWDAVNTFQLGTTEGTFTAAVQPIIGDYLSATGEVRVRVQALRQVRRGGPVPAPFTFRTNRAVIVGSQRV